MKKIIRFLREWWIFVAIIGFTVLLAVSLSIKSSDTGRTVLEGIAHGIGKLAAEAADGFKEGKKK